MNVVCHVIISKKYGLWILYEYLLRICHEVFPNQFQSTTQQARIHAICVA